MTGDAGAKIELELAALEAIDPRGLQELLTFRRELIDTLGHLLKGPRPTA